MSASRKVIKFANLLTVAVHCFTPPSISSTTTRCSSSTVVLPIKVPGSSSDTTRMAEILDAEFTVDATATEEDSSKNFKSFEKKRTATTTSQQFEKQEQPNTNNDDDDEFGKEQIWAQPDDLYRTTQQMPNINVNFGREQQQQQWATQPPNNDFYYGNPQERDPWYQQNYSRRGNQQQQQQWGQEEWGAASDFYSNVKENHDFDHDRWNAQPFGYYTHDDQQQQQTPNNSHNKKDSVAADKEPQKSADPSVAQENTSAASTPAESALSNNFNEEQRAYQEHLLIHEMTRHIDKLNKENARLRDTVDTLNHWDTVTMTWEISNFDQRVSESRSVFSSDEFEIGGYRMKLELNVMSKAESKGDDREVGCYFYHTGGSTLMPVEMDGSKVTVIGAPFSDFGGFSNENNLKSFEADYCFKIDAPNGGYGWSDVGTLSELRHGGYLTVEGSLVIEALVRIKKVRRSIS